MAEDKKRWTVLSLINWTSEYLAKAQIDNSRLAAEILLAHVLGCERIELYTRFDSEPPEDQRTQFRQLVLRAAGHEPIAYLVGKKEFYSIELKVTPDTLIPRPETEILVEQTLKCLANLDRPGFVWDVGTGSGCVAIAVAANNPDVMVLATDKDALLPGETASFANYTSYSKGINGIMRDANATGGTASASDFTFKVRN